MFGKIILVIFCFAVIAVSTMVESRAEDKVPTVCGGDNGRPVRKGVLLRSARWKMRIFRYRGSFHEEARSVYEGIQDRLRLLRKELRQ
jgi:hypothetical protein